MPKSKASSCPGEWLIIDESQVNDVVNLFVEFAEDKKIHPKIVAAAMEYIANKIKAHMRLETKDIHDGNETIH